MSTVTKLKKILEVLEKHGEGNTYMGATHDTIFLHPSGEDAPFAEELKAAGAHWNEEYRWYIYT